MQDVILRALEGIADFRGECSLKTWLFKICVNRCKDAILTGWKHPADSFDEIIELGGIFETDEPLPSDAADQKGWMESYQAALATLEYSEMLVLAMADEGSSQEVIAEALHLTVAAVNSLQLRARRKLRLKLWICELRDCLSEDLIRALALFHFQKLTPSEVAQRLSHNDGQRLMRDARNALYDSRLFLRMTGVGRRIFKMLFDFEYSGPAEIAEVLCGLPEFAFPADFQKKELKDPNALMNALQTLPFSVSVGAREWSGFSAAAASGPVPDVRNALVDYLNGIIRGPLIPVKKLPCQGEFSAATASLLKWFTALSAQPMAAPVALSAATRKFVAKANDKEALVRLNRLLLEDSFPSHIEKLIRRIEVRVTFFVEPALEALKEVFDALPHSSIDPSH